MIPGAEQLRNEIDTLMAKYAGNEHVMYLKICTKQLGDESCAVS